MSVTRRKGDPLTRYEVAADGCWIWQGALTPAGYGALRVEGRKSDYAHRFFYTHLVGPIPEGLFLDHLCRVTACVNPAHLEPVTHTENLRRGRHPAAEKTQCVNGHPFDAENTYWRPSGQRDCRVCIRLRGQRRDQRRRAERQAA